MLPALLLSIVYVRLAAVLRVSQGGSVIVGVPPLEMWRIFIKQCISSAVNLLNRQLLLSLPLPREN